MMNRSTIVAVLALALPLALSAQTPTNLDALVQRRGVYLEPRTLEPFSGPVVSRWEGAGVRERGTLVDGRWDGVHETYYLNGQLEVRETYRDGVLNGPFESYFRKGTPSDRGTYRNGQLDGPYEAYWSRMQGMMIHVHQQGQTMAGDVMEQGSYSAGKPCGEWYRFVPISGGGLRAPRSVEYPACPS